VKKLLQGFDKAFENKIRLGVMAILMVNDEVDFNTLKELLHATDGNLASHLKQLEKNDYVSFTKTFHDRKPLTQYRATDAGRKAFQRHLAALESLLK
jgi:DNA-binding MarR family transcriptional regulator